MHDLTILYNKSNPFGISKDVEGIVAALGGTGYTIHRRDPLEPPVLTDIAIHLEVPVHVWMPWATKNILVVNPEWFEEAWVPYLGRFDAVVYKDSTALAAAPGPAEAKRLVPWGCPPPGATSTATPAPGFAWFLGASKNKRAAVAPILSNWSPEYPPLHIYTTEALDLSGVPAPLPTNIEIRVGDLNATTRAHLSRSYAGHICCSAAEGFGYTAAEAEWVGAFTILNELPVYRQDYGAAASANPFVHFLSSLEEPSLAAAIAAFRAALPNLPCSNRQAAAKSRWDAFRTTFKGVVDEQKATLKKGKRSPLPPVLQPADCPPITVVTLLHNRRKFFDLACHNMMIQDYPKDKIEWIVVEDSDDPMEDASDRVMAVAAAAAPLRLEYIPLKKRTAIGKKRNLACERATGEIILMMDDDDHYPETSFRRRVAWLTRGPWSGAQVAACTTIACYDLVKGISAVNVPPMTLPFEQRVSEATLTFRRSWWEAGHRFSDSVQIGEGESILAGSTEAGEVVEIPPQQVIVAFSHGKNASSRRVPSGADIKPGCFWGFPREYLEYVHGLAGVKVVAEKKS